MTRLEDAHLLTAAEVAQLFKLASTRTVYVMAQAGEIPCVRIGRRLVRFDPIELKRWIANGGTDSTSMHRRPR